MKKVLEHHRRHHENTFYFSAILILTFVTFLRVCSSSPTEVDVQLITDCQHNATLDVTTDHGAIHCVDLTYAQIQIWRIIVPVNKTIKIHLVEFNAVPCSSASNCTSKNKECDAISIYDHHPATSNKDSPSKIIISRICAPPPENGIQITTTTNVALIKYQPGTGIFRADSESNKRSFLISFESMEVGDDVIIFPTASTSQPLPVAPQPKKSSDVKSVVIGISIGAGILVVIGIAIGFYCHYYRRKKLLDKRYKRSRPSDARGIPDHEADGLNPRNPEEDPPPIVRKLSRAADLPMMKQDDVLANLQLTMSTGDDFKLKPKSMLDVSDAIMNDNVFALPFNHLELTPEQLRFSDEPIGIGSFGVIYKATFIPTHAETPSAEKPIRRQVAVKKVRLPNESYHQALEAELKLLTYISPHPYIIELVGAITFSDEDFSVVLEYCELGTLQQFIGNFRQIEPVNGVSNCKPPIINLGDLLLLAEQIANGMQFVHHRKCAHRDLAARNIFLTAKRIPKITDFGLGRTLNPSAFFTTKQDGEFPWKWCALEVLQGELFDPRSDIWSFGVLMWELFSLGRKPYSEVLRCNSEFLDGLKNGLRLPRPNNSTPKQVYNFMLQCWRMIPDDRPPFSELERMLLAYRTS